MLLSVFAYAIAGALLLTAPAAAQDADLARVDSLRAAGEVAGARAQLDAWWRGVGGRAPSADRAHAHLLRAELAADPAAAEDDYLTVALDFPTTRFADLALLRAGQALLARGEAERAVFYLERLERDHPQSTHRFAGLVWLARARRAAKLPDACAAAAAAAAAAPAGDAAARALADAERTGCTRAAVAASAGVAAAAAAAPPAEAAPPSAGSTVPRETMAPRFAVQLGAFRSRAGAENVAVRVRRLGLEPRLVVVDGGTLVRVRVGRFTSSVDAAALRARLVQQGFDAAVVDDVQREAESAR